MNNKAELIQAFEDYQAGKLGVIPTEPRHLDVGTADHPGHDVL